MSRVGLQIWHSSMNGMKFLGSINQEVNCHSCVLYNDEISMKKSGVKMLRDLVTFGGAVF